MLMQAQAQTQAPADSDALSLTLGRAGEPRRRQRSVQNRCDVPELDHPEIKRDASTFYDRGGALVAASAWLAFYVFAVIHSFIASGN
jgi:hypothetical protein